MAPAMDLELGMILSNTYKITGKLGAGGMGSVYSAEHQRLPRSYAIKVLHEAVKPDSEFYHRFRREAEICSRLNHENIVEVVDFNFTPDGRPYIAMELLDGEDLDSLLDREGRLGEEQTLDIVTQAAAGLSEAHEQGVVHRDLKPQNVFLCKRRTGDALVKIVDFGISKIQGSDTLLTAAHTLVGTPYYMSPEQTGAGDGKVTARSDIYALGVITYQMLSGEMPITGDSLARIVMAINTQRPRPLRELVPELSPAVEAVIDVALAKDPIHRFGGVSDFAEALRRAVEIGDLMGIDGHSSVVETVAASGGERPDTLVDPPDEDLSQTSAYDGRAFGSQPAMERPAQRELLDAAPTVRTPNPHSLGALGAAVRGGQPDHPTIRERPAGARDKPKLPVPAAEAEVSKTTLSSAAGESTVSPAVEGPRSYRGKVLLVLGGLALIFGVALTYSFLGGRGDAGSGGSGPGKTSPGPGPDARAAPREAPPMAERPAPGAGRVVIRLQGLPAGGRCTLGGKAVEGNPLVIPHGDTAVRLVCAAEGYQPRSVDLVPNRDRVVQMQFERLAPRRPPARAMRPRRRPMRRVMAPPMRRRARPIDSDIPIE